MPRETERPEEEERIARRLKSLVRESGMSLRAVSVGAGYHADYLSQVLAGNQALKVRHILAVLGVLGIDPVAFWGHLADGGRRLEETGPLQALAPPSVRDQEIDEIRRRLRLLEKQITREDEEGARVPTTPPSGRRGNGR